MSSSDAAAFFRRDETPRAGEARRDGGARRRDTEAPATHGARGAQATACGISIDARGA
jgi:hypothetical protein